jgi:retinoid hydroxylase
VLFTSAPEAQAVKAIATKTKERKRADPRIPLASQLSSESSSESKLAVGSARFLTHGVLLGFALPMPAPAPPPPGSSGLPLVGETLSFVGDIFGFVRTRRAAHGPVFRTHLLGNPTVILAGPAACELWLDETKIQREGGFPPSLEALFGGKNILPLLDGETHRTRKALVMTGFGREAIESYLPTFETLLIQTLGRWAEAGEVNGLDELKRLSITGIARTILGLQDADDADDKRLLHDLLADYALLFRGITGLPIDAPLTDYHHGLAAKDRILERFAGLVEARQASPRRDAISRILAARTAAGAAIAPEDLTLELHHFVLAGYILFAELGTMVQEIARNSALRGRLVEEIDNAKIRPRKLVGLTGLNALPLVQRVVQETKRFCPNVPLSFGKAREAFEFSGYSIGKGWYVFLAVTENNVFEKSFAEPHRFDPDRFAPPRNEQEKPNAYVPQGPGTTHQHKCAGADLSTYLMAAFLVHLVGGYEWSLPEQDLSLRWNLVPPEQVDGLRFRISRRPPRS